MKKTIFTIAAALAITACSGFLEEYSQDEIRPRKVSDYSELINGEIYNKQNNTNYANWLDIMTDDVEDVYSRPMIVILANDVRNGAYGYYAWQAVPEYSYSNELSPDNTWTACYHQILTSNMILDGIDAVEGTDAERQTVIGEALAIRAYAYFLLVNLYGEPYDPATASTAMGVPINDLVGAENRNFHRAPVGEIYEIIVKDLQDAIAALQKGGNANGKWRWNANAATLLLARTYLYMQEWDKAIEAASRVIDMTGGILWDLNDKVVNAAASYFICGENPEIIFTYGYGYSAFSATGANGYFPVSTSLRSTFKTGDRRLNNSNGAYVRRVGSILTGTKYVPYKSDRWPEESGAHGYAFRTAEAYLIRAEALSHTTDYIKALDDLNTLRQNRIAPANYQPLELTDQEEIIQFVREERRREFCFEKLRWFDLRRWDRPSITHVYHTDYTDRNAILTFVLEENDPAYTLPIPMAVMQQDADVEPYNKRPNRAPQEGTGE